MQPEISVIICSHNPRKNYIKRVLQALKEQTLQIGLWELLLIDNASNHPLSSEIDLNWHPQARHIREEKLGLTCARLRGIKESVADVLIFVDDDNVLNKNYLEVALNISKDWHFIGAWGGQIFPEFEKKPPEWTKAYWSMLAIREFEQNKWSNILHSYDSIPCGAGLCVREIVARQYFELLQNNPERLGLDRRGQVLTSCGDLDLALTSCDIGLGTGQFLDLKLTHLIPSSRLEEDYLLKLSEANGYSVLLMEFIRGKVKNLSKPSWRSYLFKQYQLWRMDSRNRRFYQAFTKGQFLAIQEIRRIIK